MVGSSQKMWGPFSCKQRCSKHEQNLIKSKSAGQMKQTEQRSDRKIAAEIANTIQCITTIPVESLRVTVNEDWACLQGTLKDRHSERGRHSRSDPTNERRRRGDKPNQNRSSGVFTELKGTDCTGNQGAPCASVH